MDHRKLKSSLLAFMLLLLFSSNVIAQKIVGSVRDQATNTPIVGAVIHLDNSPTEAYAKLDGNFEIPKCSSGNHQLKITADGYKSSTVQIVVEGNQNLQVPITLKSTDEDIEEVAFVGRHDDRRGDQNREKNADQVMNVISAHNIALMPDITVANIMQRISGVTVDRNSSGEGRYPVIRGMDKRFNTTLVNGIKIPSPDNNNRYVPMDIFPAELLERLEVIKSLTPDMEGDAIGGTMNLVMKNAPAKQLLQINTGLGFTNFFSKSNPYQEFDHSVVNKKSPTELYGNGYTASPGDIPRKNLVPSPINTPINSIFTVTYGNRFGKQKRFGVLASGTYQNNYRGTDSYYLMSKAQPITGNIPAYSDMYNRQYSTQNKRLGINLKLDYDINKNNKISLYNLYLRMDQLQSRKTVDSILAIQRVGPGLGNIEITERTSWQIQQIENHTLKGEHKLSDKLFMDWNAVYSFAKNEMPDQAEYSTIHSVEIDGVTGKRIVTPSALENMTALWRHNTDRDYSGYWNLAYSPRIWDHKTRFKIGALYRDKKRNNYYNEYTLSVNGGKGSQTNVSILDGDYIFRNDAGKGDDSGANNYTTTEKIMAGYIQAELELTNKLQLIGGVRVEGTKDHFTTQLPDNVSGKYGTITYKDALPSAQLKYAISKNQDIRVAFYKAIARPGYFEIIPSHYQGDIYPEGGNPYLKRTRSSNFDIRYEMLSGFSNQFMVGGFYKDITDPIEMSLGKDPKAPLLAMLSPNNFGNARNYGAEVVFTHYFGNFGISTNYTFTQSKITTDKALIENNTKQTVTQTRPLQGQAKHIGNFSLLYKNQKLGLDAQVAYVYTGERISQVSPYYNLDYWQKPYESLDVSVEKIISKNFTIYLKANNLTNSAMKVFQKQPNSHYSGADIYPYQESAKYISVQRDLYKSSFLVGLKYKM